MSMNEAMNQLEMAKKEITKLQMELEAVKKENLEYKQNQFANALKMSNH